MPRSTAARELQASAVSSSGASSSTPAPTTAATQSAAVKSVLDALRRVPAWARRMLQQRAKDGTLPPILDADELEEAVTKITAARLQLEGPEGSGLVESVLANEPIAVGILQLVAFGLRLPLLRDTNNEQGVHRWNACMEAYTVMIRLFATADSPAPPAVDAAQRRLAKGLLENQTLQAAAVQLATAADGLQGGAGPPSESTLSASAQCLAIALHLCITLGHLCLPPVTGWVQDLVATLAEARLMEHAGRLLMVLSRWVDPTRHAAWQNQGAAITNFTGAYRYFSMAMLFPGCPPAVGQIISGPCTRHAATVLGLAALRELEGGAEPGEGGGAGSAGEGGGGGAACPCLARRHNVNRADMYPLLALTSTLDPELTGLPRPLTASRLLLRVGFAVAAGGGGAGGAAGGAGSSTGPAPLSPQTATSSGPAAFFAVVHRLPAGQLCRGPWLGLTSDVWRLAAALLSQEVLGEGLTAVTRDSLCKSIEDLLAANTAEAWDGGSGSWRLPAEPPPPVAAALAGGTLPFLERLLRRAGGAPRGLEAALALRVAAGTRRGTWRHASVLLAYGEALQAAALVATTTKLLRRTDARTLLAKGLAAETGGVGLAVATEMIAACGDSWSSDIPSPPALGRLAVVLSLALPEWLTELSRLVRQAVALDEAAWQEEQRRERGPGVGSGVGATDLGALYSIVPPLLGDYSLLSSTAGGGSAAASCSGGGVADGGGGTADGGRGGVLWPPPELVLAEVVGAALGLLQRRRPDPHAWPHVYWSTCLGALHIAETQPEEVRALGVSGSAFAWRPEAVRAVAAACRIENDPAGEPSWEDEAEALEAVARQLEAWADGEDGDGLIVQGALMEWPRLILYDRLAYAVGGLLVPPAEARRRLGLPACSNPACANLAGDSEAGRQLQQCGRCGRASYCCRECQTAHWRSGHKEACGGPGGGGEAKAG
ncbi:hypothetical protein HYH03_008534 [Edaphochlamys debaryana]|uniref:phytol kinase n=1 Tax=Edaphochlamys debaryana TaxID=47281 RepID=A0A836BZH3_9CHLO|nr:hypothetical protein HYH03_008534 [Edaphochlamys debaryana]|eukprot:KAG2493408.1 hypothetical protein HYH03_008534 [Edaphochlamys debaryana]